MAKKEKSRQPSASAVSKVPQALMPNSRLFLIFLILFAVVTFIFTDSYWLSGAEGGIITALTRAPMRACRSVRADMTACA